MNYSLRPWLMILFQVLIHTTNEAFTLFLFDPLFAYRHSYDRFFYFLIFYVRWIASLIFACTYIYVEDVHIHIFAKNYTFGCFCNFHFCLDPFLIIDWYLHKCVFISRLTYLYIYTRILHCTLIWGVESKSDLYCMLQISTLLYVFLAVC